MDSLTAQISTAVSRDRVRWWKTYNYNDHINTMKTWLQNRYTWLNREWDLYRDCIPIEPLPLVISMINYHPMSQLGFNADDLEFLCIVNNSDDTVDASGVYFRELGLSYTFPAGSLIPPQGEVFLASNAQALQQCYHKTAYGEFLRHLDNKSERLVLADAWGNIIDEVTYADTLPWPVDADGHGDFLILLDHDLDNALPESWISADNFVGLPDREPSVTLSISPNPTTGLVRIDSDQPLTSITITDAQGRTLTSIPANGDTTFALDLTPYPAGVYFVTANLGDGTKGSVKVVRK
jgi:hypothetical protein